jgi:hypothetical protein
MPAPYSEDLRQKAVEAVDRGEAKCQICRTLHISRNTLDLWLKRREETGSVAAKRAERYGPSPKIMDLNAFQSFADLEILQNYAAADVVYMDEAGADNTEDYAYGWCHHTERFKADKLGHRTSRICMIAAWCNRQLIARTPMYSGVFSGIN